jgi:hypothetical protein
MPHPENPQSTQQSFQKACFLPLPRNLADLLICDDFQLVNQFSERNDNSHKEIITFKIHEVDAQRLVLAAAAGLTRLHNHHARFLAKRACARAAQPPSATASGGQPCHRFKVSGFGCE